MGGAVGGAADALRFDGDHRVQVGLEGAEHLEELLEVEQLVALDLFGGRVDLDAGDAHRALPEDAAVGAALDGEHELLSAGVEAFARPVGRVRFG